MVRAFSRRSALRLAGAAASLLSLRGAAARQDELVRESIYNYIIVSREDQLVSFRRMENGAKISAIDMTRPAFQVIPYTKYLFAGALVAPHPASVLNIGLGAGAFNRLFNLAFPEAMLTSVEIDPMIKDLAVEFTQFAESPRNQVVIEDGRRYLHRSGDRWDWIVIDAFVKNSQYPPHMATREFFDLVAEHLSDSGVFVINTIAGNALYDCLVATIAASFGGAATFEVPDKGNVIVLATKGANPLLQRPPRANPPPMRELADNGVNLSEIRAAAAPAGPNACKAVLTDDFAPTEFLGGQAK